ncbi:MAG: sulfatase [Planctomycetota bacterium]|jgi:arylsulfatase A-like enzyme|nr:sulfatase [Planctomycetota bacterium]
MSLITPIRRGALSLALWTATGLLLSRLGLLTLLDHHLRAFPLDVTLWRATHDVEVTLAHCLVAATAATALALGGARCAAGWGGLAIRAAFTLLMGALFLSALSGWPTDDPYHVPGVSTARGRGALMGLAAIALTAAGLSCWLARAMLLDLPPGRILRRGATLTAGAVGALVLPGTLGVTLGRLNPERNVRERVREVAFEPASWKGVRASPRGEPQLGVLCPSRDYRVDGGDLPSLIMPPPCRLSFRISEEDGEVFLQAAAGIDEKVAQGTPRGAEHRIGFEVRVNDELVFDHEVVARRGQEPAERAWARVGGAEGLALVPGDVVELRTLWDEPATGAGPPAKAPLQVGFGRLVLERALVKDRVPSSPEAPNIVLIVMDTLRQDRLHCYGHERETSPNLDALARRGLLFENAYATSSWTWPSTASILTGLPPETHGVVADGACHLRSSLDTLPRALEHRSFTTGAITCNPLIVANKNFDLGFGSFDAQMTFRKTKLVIDSAREWLEMHADARFFLYLHLVDPHAPYEPSARARAAIESPGRPAGFPERGINEYSTRLLKGEGHDADGNSIAEEVIPADHARWMSDVYDQAVFTSDQYVGMILEHLRVLGLDQKTIVAFTSDHGEELLDHGLLTHGISLYGELTRVPLILAGPGVPEGRTVQRRVSNRHLAPTLARFGGTRILGLEDWEDLTRIDESDPRPVFFSTHQGFWNGRRRQPIYGVIDGEWELHWCRRGGPWGGAPAAGGDRRLFHIATDPDQRTDVAAEHPERVAELDALLREHLRQADRRKPRYTVGGGGRTEQMLRDIGYVDRDEEEKEERDAGGAPSAGDGGR